MNDPIQVVSQLRKRWKEQYGDDLHVEDIRRKLGRLLEEVQEKELRSVFACWTGAELAHAIEVLFDYDYHTKKTAHGTILMADPAPSGTPQVAPTPPATQSESLIANDTEYLPIVDRAASELIAAVQLCPTCPTNVPTKRKGGRPPGAKNKPKV